MANYYLDARGNGQILNVEEEICKDNSAWQSIEISKLELLGKVLVLDDIIQLSELDKDRYHETITHPVVQTAVKTPNCAAEVLILGGGDGIIAGEVLKYSGVGVTLVDIDDRVIELCKKHLSDMNNSSLSSPWVRVKTEDALQFVASAKAKSYDAICLDITDPHPESPSRSLLGKDAILSYKSLLTPGGIIVCQTDNPMVTPQHKEQVLRTFSSTFHNTGEFGITALTFSGLFSFVWASDYHKELLFNENVVRTRWLSSDRFEMCKKILDLA